MAKFHKSNKQPSSEKEKSLSKEELDAKRQAAMEAKNIIAWKSPVTVFKPRSKTYFIKVALFGLVAALAAVAFGEVFLVGVVIALVFVVYVLATAEPQVIEHRITSMGIVSGGKVFLWEDLDSFWFDKRGDERVLVVQTYLRFPSRLIIILTTVSERALLDIMEKHIHYYHGPVHTLFDKWARSLQKRVNLE